jgi:hypothetical protein
MISEIKGYPILKRARGGHPPKIFLLWKRFDQVICLGHGKSRNQGN